MISDIQQIPSKRRGKGRAWIIASLSLLFVSLLILAAVGGWWLATLQLIAKEYNSPVTDPLADIPVVEIKEQMPDVRGLSTKIALQVLTDSGIPADVISTYDTPSAAAEGVIVEQSPAFGSSNVSQVTLGIAVPTVMPEILGVTQEEAIEMLTRLGVVAETVYEYVAGSTPGTVLTTVPDVGNPLGFEATITVATAGTTLPLSQLRAIEGRCTEQNNVSINGKDYDATLICPGRSDKTIETTWMFAKSVDRVTAIVGIPDDGKPGSTSEYSILLDGVAVHEGTASFGRTVVIDFEVGGAIQMSIRIEKANENDVDVAFGSMMIYGTEDAITRLETR